MEQNLSCPITQELLDDPVVVPCCTKAFSRASLTQALQRKPECPMCRGDLSGFDVKHAPKNVVLAGLVEALRGAPPAVVMTKQNVWLAHVNPVVEGSLLELKLELRNSQFVTNPSLFIACVDRSGSMSGGPWRQVKSALVHIAGLSETNPMVKLVIISYESVAKVEPTSVAEIRMFPEANGGTNFEAAFGAIKGVLLQHADTDISSATIAFLTDGQSGGDRQKLISSFREMLQETWRKRLSCHAVGFGGACDKELLEGLRTENGTFRYAEPGEEDDSLCHKLTSLFDVAAMTSLVPIQIRTEQPVLIRAEREFVDARAGVNLSFPIQKNGTGELCVFVQVSSALVAPLSLVLDSALDQDVRIECRQGNLNRMQRWCAAVLDDVASELLQLTGQKLDPMLFELRLGLLEQKVRALRAHGAAEDKAEFLLQSIQQLSKGMAVNIGKISDMRFASKFADGGAPKKTVAALAIDDGSEPVVRAIAKEEAFKERSPPRYNRNPLASRGRNALQVSIVENLTCICSAKTKELLESSNPEDGSFVDADGNNALHLAAYCGQYETVKELVQRFKYEDLGVLNKAGESAVTLCIKKRGFHKTLNALLDAGALIDPKRLKGLEQYALDNKFQVTATFLANMSSGDQSKVDASMTDEYILFVYNRLKDAGKPLDLQNFFYVACARCMVDFCEKLLGGADGASIKVTASMLANSIPPKPDHPETEKYLRLTRLILGRDASLLNAKNDAGEPPLFRAADMGSLPHVKFFLDSGADIEGTNPSLNTALWIACAKRFPCIVTELIERGADVNRLNDKGNPPLYSVMQKGPMKILEEMVQNGARVDVINQNGDTFLLLACRNGQPEILSFLLNMVDPEFVRFRAKIDGFDAVFASVEGNRPECLKVLHDYDKSLVLNTFTAVDNEIIPGASPLHLAAFYGRVDAARMLLSLGCDPNVVDLVNGQTPLHIAVLQGQVPLVTLLKDRTNRQLRDRFGNTAVSYARSAELKDALFERICSGLTKLALGMFTKEQEVVACEAVKQHCGIIGILPPKRALDVLLPDGSTALMLSVKYSNYNVAKALIDLGCSMDEAKSALGVSLRCFAGGIGNPRILSLVGKLSDEDAETVARIKKEVSVGGNAKAIFLVKPPNLVGVKWEAVSTIDARMDLSSGEDGKVEDTAEINLYEAKLKTFELLACRATGDMQAKEALAVALYANNKVVAKQFKVSMFKETFMSNELLIDFTRGLLKLPPFTEECFVAAHAVDREAFSKGKIVSFPFFFSAASLWRVATEQLPDFASKKREGVVFIIKPLSSARHISSFGTSADAEVCVLPFAKFRVHEWYHGDPIALGQRNIREHTFKVKSATDMTKWDGVVAGKARAANMTLEEMVTSKKSLIIELHEIERHSETGILSITDVLRK